MGRSYKYCAPATFAPRIEHAREETSSKVHRSFLRYAYDVTSRLWTISIVAAKALKEQQSTISSAAFKIRRVKVWSKRFPECRAQQSLCGRSDPPPAFMRSTNLMQCQETADPSRRHHISPKRLHVKLCAITVLRRSPERVVRVSWLYSFPESVDERSGSTRIIGPSR